MREQVKFWRWQSSSGSGTSQAPQIELLRAHYITHSFNRHIHDTFAIGIIQQGAEEFSYRGATHVAGAGSIALINPGEVHTGHAASEAGWIYRMLYPDVRILQQAASEAAGKACAMPYFPDPVVYDEDLTGLILRLHIALEQQPSQLEQDSRLLWTMTQLIARYAGDRPTLKTPGQESQAIRHVRQYLDTHYADNPALADLAAIANLSPYYLLRSFRQHVGLPPHEYLTQVRLYRAKDLLAAGCSITDVAQLTGFADQSHLTRHFKRMMGVTPGQYRR